MLCGSATPSCVLTFTLQNTTAYLTVAPEENQTTKAFHSLHWGTEYCVSVMVEGVGSLSASRPSKQCLQLPEQGKDKNNLQK